MMQIQHNNPAFVQHANDAITAEVIESTVSIIENEHQGQLSQYLEGDGHDTYFADVENGQAFFFSGKRKDGIFIKTGKRRAMLIMPNAQDTESFQALYGTEYKFKNDSLVNVVSMTCTFSPPRLISHSL